MGSGIQLTRKLFLGIISIVCIGCIRVNLPTMLSENYEDIFKQRPVGANILLFPDTVVSVGDTVEIYGWVFDQFNHSYRGVSVVGTYPITVEPIPELLTQDLAKFPSSWALFFVVTNDSFLGRDFFRLTVTVPGDTTKFPYNIPLRVVP
jgi:hypothetical protein